MMTPTSAKTAVMEKKIMFWVVWLFDWVVELFGMLLCVER